MPYDDIYNDRIHKWSLNVPVQIWEKMSRKTSLGTKWGGRKSVYVLSLIEQDLDKVGRRCDDPPRKYEGAISGRKRNSFVWRWLKKKV